MAQTSVELRKLLHLTNFKLFDFDYQFDDLNMKKKIEQAITDYYYTYEVNGDTVDEFKFRFKRRYLMIIDYYNNLHNTTLFDYNPFINSSTTETTKQKNSGQTDFTGNSESSNNSNKISNSTGNNKSSDYPQQSISGGNYLSGEQANTTQSKDDVTDNSITENITKNITTSNIEFEKKVEALVGTTYQDLIQKERANLINLIDMVIEEMKPCFILVY